MEIEHVDVVIVGAGISGIDAAYHLQTQCPTKSYVILEGRDTLGGTWDLFKYPGIRSDSDMLTLGFPFRPWPGERTIADGASILAYLKDTAEHFGIDKKIRYRQRVEHAEWSSKTSRWTIHTIDPHTNQTRRLTCGFLFTCAGYYDYDKGYTPAFPGREKFRGQIIHPQFWRDDIDYAGKRIVVIGSGATAVTLAPSLAKTAAHVTMLQRSPTYIASIPARDPTMAWLRKHASPRVAASASRWKNIAVTMAFFQFCRRFPKQASKFLIRQVDRQIDGKVDVKTHFTPSYKPWDQRLCLVPDADLFRAIRDGSVSVVTDHIETFTETGIRLKSGQTLDADMIITATGLVLRPLGGMKLVVDGEPVDLPNTMLYRGMMCSGVPNYVFSIGYTNASWTLKCDLTSQYVCRLLNHMEKRGYTRCAPRRDPSVEEAPVLDFTSGYVQRGVALFPRLGAVVPWRLYQNYALDLYLIKHAKIEDGALQLS
ncbi:MAG TPA: NAD(P)/FAD-dependent oxidoreductase [Kofleriaceae bacterium]|nr:NAD(P)/FAD-dependent oxidoreductase [Kofleriaceae bacterium]